MLIKEKNQTKLWIIEALIELLNHKAYHDITVSQIVNKAGLGRRTFYRYFKTKNEVIEYLVKLLFEDFSDTILKNHAISQENILKSYFEFWELHIEILQLLNKAHLLYFIEENLLSLFYQVALKTKHIPQTIDQDTDKLPMFYEQYKYAFIIKLSGIWRATILWCSENPRRTPAEMSKLINNILKE